jgi:putative ABC transport system permease protein
LNANDSADVDTIVAELNDNATVKLALTKSEMANTWEQFMSILNAMVYILIAAAAVLALTVVYNISAINIFERRRDVATLKVLGYHRKEVNRLLFRENLFITGFGSLLGIGAGAGMLWIIITAVVSDEMVVPMVMSPLSVLYAVVLGFAFTALANQLLRGKIRRIDMVESLKSVE